MEGSTDMDQAKTEALLRLLRDRSLDRASHAELYSARGRTKDPELQAAIAPAEHAAFSRELVADKPWMAPALAVAVPAYEGGKALGLIKARTPASWESLGGGWHGIGQGLVKAVRKARGKPDED